MQNTAPKDFTFEFETYVPADEHRREHPIAAHIAHQFLNWFSGVSAAISLTPFILSALNIGKVKEVRSLVDFNGACCSIIASKKPFGNGNYSLSSISAGRVFEGFDGKHKGIQGNTYGIAGLISHTLLKVPKVGYHLGTGALPEQLKKQLQKIPKHGDYLAELRLANALAAGGIILLGELSGAALEKWEKKQAVERAEAQGKDPETAKAKAGKKGRALALGSKAFGLFIALPTVLAGVGHSIQITTATFGMDNVSDITDPKGIGGHIMAFLGKPMGECGGQFKAPTGAATAGLVGLCCTIPVIIGLLPLLTTRKAQSSKARDISMSTTPLSPKNYSPAKDNLKEVITYHHAIDWDKFTKETQEVTERLVRLEQETAHRQKLGRIAKWGIRIIGTAGILLAGNRLLKKQTDAVIDMQDAETAIKEFDKAKKDLTTPTLLLDRVSGATEPPIPTEQAGQELAQKFFKRVLEEKPGKITFRAPNPKTVENMKDGGNTLPGCCIKHESHCCGGPMTYIRRDIGQKLSNALSDLLEKLPNPGKEGRKGQLKFAATMTTGVGAVFGLASQAEKHIVGSRPQELTELHMRDQALRGIVAHMERDGQHAQHATR